MLRWERESRRAHLSVSAAGGEQKRSSVRLAGGRAGDSLPARSRDGSR